MIAGALARHPREFVGLLMAAAATLAILVNALFLQHGPHPAPIFAARPLIAHERPAMLPRPHEAAPAPQAAEPRSQAQIVGDIQRELHRRGFYDGAVDGIWGAKTDAAARDFVQAAGVTVDPAPGANLLHAITAAGAKVGATAAPAPAREDAIAKLIVPDKRVLAVQRALADFGYGQIKPSGVYDQDTRAAIEKFERDRKLAVDGQMSNRFVRELAAMTGRPLE